jgi:Family of unknown function (DUF6152)
MRSGVFWALMATSALAAPAAAHHSAAAFDTSKEVAVEGVITKFDWRNPHIYMALRVAGADGREIEQEIEAGASSVLLPLGLTPDAVAIGERVTVRGNPARAGPGRTMLGRELVKADGSVLPLNIGSAASRAAPRGVSAASIAGTWFPAREGFYGFMGSRRSWALTDNAKREAAAFDTRTASYTDCVPVTAPTLMVYPVISVIEVASDVVKMHVDWMTSERIVYLDGRGHPENGEATLQGHSIGRWEGQTLVVDTTQFASHKEGLTLGVPAGPRKHVVERFTVNPDRAHLDYEVVVEDPDYLTAPITYKSRWNYRPDLAPTGLKCDLDVARRFLTQE